jgi:hypothetical protein
VWAFFRTVEQLRRRKPAKGEDVWLPFIVGIIERTLYFGAAALSSYEIVAGWLALKAVAKFAETSTLKSERKIQKPGTEQPTDTIAAYYLYICGTGLSLIFGSGCGLLARHLQHLDLIVQK